MRSCTLLQIQVSHPALRLVVEGVASATRAFENLLDEAAEAAQRVLDDASASPPAVEWAVFGGTLAAALTGRVDDAAVIVERGRQIENKVDGLLRYPTAYGEIRALTLVGDFDEAEARSGDIGRISSPGQYLAWGMANVLVGTVEVARGRFGSAAPRMEETVAALAAESAASWSFPAGMLLAQSHCVLGNVDAGAKIVSELAARSAATPPSSSRNSALSRRGLPPPKVTSAERFRDALEAADLAKASVQRAVEMFALHDAARFGDLTSLHDSSTSHRISAAGLPQSCRVCRCLVGSPNAAELCSAAERFEAIGALLSAADAMAQAAALFRTADDRRRAQDAAAAADRLAAACGGVQTPALELASQPLPLSPREREIANFVSQGLSNRDIADRLVVSTRTVEGHIYRACIKLDVTDPEGLALVIGRGRGN